MERIVAATILSVHRMDERRGGLDISLGAGISSKLRAALLSGDEGGELEASLPWMQTEGGGGERKEWKEKVLRVSVTLPLYSTLYPLQISSVWVAPSSSASSV